MDHDGLARALAPIFVSFAVFGVLLATAFGFLWLTFVQPHRLDAQPVMWVSAKDLTELKEENRQLRELVEQLTALVLQDAETTRANPSEATTVGRSEGETVGKKE